MASGDRRTGHERIDHTFNFPQFDYDAPGILFQPAIKIQFFFSKLGDVSWEHFSKHYAHVHADMTVAAEAFGAFNVRRYTQQHQSPSMKDKAIALGMSPLDYDGCSTMWFANWDDAEKFFAAPSYRQLADDCKYFMDTSRGIKVFAGQEVICFGKAIPDVDSQDGITEHKKSN
ncbi:EthD domain-containing protein [Emericellopsis atlantica]|uniref:EthD domain-containing protein n=1 Tax=Emericellopsis atlantica TaxID=2614577 RepID=A0A9P8CTC7_9HYPO|nr:EthD domain-containing protein [Emericellopsis atlantica]KAG9258703.1 EthD domain-containing protein [Emericellopsis atlantica]